MVVVLVNKLNLYFKALREYYTANKIIIYTLTSQKQLAPVYIKFFNDWPYLS